jgi:O-antigen/teichoic acid export membrane protein
LPLGISSKLFDLRRLGEQWIVAFLFAPSVFSVFSVAANILPLVQLIRKPVQSVILPKMSKAQGLADINSVKLLNKRGNVVVSMVLLPMIALLMILAEVLMTVLFGQNYKGAGLIFQVYLLGVLPQAVEVGSILVAFAQARFMMRVGLIVAVFSLTVSYIGAKTLGPAGAAIGSVVAGFVDLGIRLRRASEVTDTPIKELQDWDNLVVIALAVVASAVVTITVRNALHFESPWLDMSLSTAIFGATYFSVLMLSGSKWVLEALTGTTRDR